MQPGVASTNCKHIFVFILTGFSVERGNFLEVFREIVAYFPEEGRFFCNIILGHVTLSPPHTVTALPVLGVEELGSSNQTVFKVQIDQILLFPVKHEKTRKR